MDEHTVCRLLTALLLLAAIVDITTARPVNEGRLQTMLVPWLATSDLTG
jgi:hypothetical protein